MKQLFDQVSNDSTKLITKKYSTSFSIAVRLLKPNIRQAIYNIYGFVRTADEIVDSFNAYPQEKVFNNFVQAYKHGLKYGISPNPVINAFQQTIYKYNIDLELVDAFLDSMRADLTKRVYSRIEEMDEYIYGSADVVGLMCLKVFVNGNEEKYKHLRDSAMRLGSAFQKVNFLRDLKQDSEVLGRQYFPNINPNNLNPNDKSRIVNDIKRDFEEAYKGIKMLPKEARFGVYVAYKYYCQLLKKVEKTPAKKLQEKRIRVSNTSKTYLLLESFFYYKLNII